MDTPPETRPPGKPRDASGARQARQEREAAALRENLRKRKDQARARQAPDQPEAAPDTPNDA